MKTFYVSRDLYEQGREGIEAVIRKIVLKWAAENIPDIAPAG
jgi:hypothetical protein